VKRFELALHTFLAKSAHCKIEHPAHGIPDSESATGIRSDSDNTKGKGIIDSCTNERLETDLGKMSLKSDLKDPSMPNLLVEFANSAVDFNNAISDSNQRVQLASYVSSPNLNPRYPCDMEGTSLGNSLSDTYGARTSCYVEVPLGAGTITGVSIEGPSEEGSCYHSDNNNRLVRDQSRHCFSSSSSNGPTSSDWGRYGTPSLSWGGHVGRRQVKPHPRGNYVDEDDVFLNIFEGGSLLYCNMSFDALLNVRKQLEEIGFPCKAVNDGLWLQVGLRLI
jgi:hypothetical protein